MKDNSETSKRDPDMLDEYDFSNGVRGKYAHLHSQKRSTVKVKISSSKTSDDSEEETVQPSKNK